MARRARTRADDSPTTDLKARRRVLEARAVRLAARTTEPVERPHRTVIVCQLGEALVGLPVEDVRRIAPLSRLGSAPSTHPAFVGLAVDAGAVVQVFGLGRLLDQPDKALGQAGDYLIVLREGPLALCVGERPVAARAEPDEDDAATAAWQVAAPGSPLHEKTLTLMNAADLPLLHKPLPETIRP